MSSKSQLLEAWAKIAELEVEAKFLKETQAIKMASEEVKLKKVLAQAKKTEQIDEQASNKEISPFEKFTFVPNTEAASLSIKN